MAQNAATHKLQDIKDLAVYVLQSEAKNPRIGGIEQMRGCFLHFTQDRLPRVRMTASGFSTCRHGSPTPILAYLAPLILDHVL